MAIKENIVEGMRLTHTVHGDGRVKKISERVNPKTKVAEKYADVSFSSINGKVSWSALINNEATAGIKPDTDTSLNIITRVSDIATGDNWFLVDDYGDLSEMLVDIERLSASHSAITPISDDEPVTTQIITLGKNLDKADLSPSGDPVNILKIIVDWSAKRLINQAENSKTRSKSVRLGDITEWHELAESGELWAKKLYFSLPEMIRAPAERVLVSVVGMISVEHEVSMAEAARILSVSLEKRVENIHLKKIKVAKSRLEADAEKVV